MQKTDNLRRTVFDDKTGKKFGNLTAKKYLGKGEWLCECDCGNLKIARSGHLNAGKAVSCGCMEYELRSKAGFKHGGIKHPLYIVWEGMKQRCDNPNHTSYSRYGGRGIKVCDEWENDFSSFQRWSLSNGYKKGLTIDRIDNDKGYCPDNCRWITPAEQARNNSKNRRVYLISETEVIIKEYGTIAEAAEDTGSNENLIGRVCMGRLKSTNGLRWKYADEQHHAETRRKKRETK